MTIQPFDIAIDVGDAQPVIDWAQVYASGIRIAMIKATEGTGFVSPTWAAQSAGALAAGVKIVPYHFLRPGAAQPQIEHFAESAGLAQGQAFALDWEGRAASTCPPDICEAVGDVLGAHLGRLPLGYWGIPGSAPGQPTALMQTWDRWVPRYPLYLVSEFDSLSPTLQESHRPIGSLFWQYTCTGRVQGIPGSVDRSVVYANSIEEALAWCDTGVRPL